MQVIVKLTNACNLRCKYCSEGDYEVVNNLSFSLLQKLVDDLPELLDNIGDNSIDFLWHGGEPLCYPKEMLCQAMDYAIKRLSDKYRVSFSMQSNGTLINGDWIRIIKQYNIHLGISLDGYRELHDSRRVTQDDKPTFQSIVDNILCLRNNGIEVGTLMVLDSASDIDIDELFEVITKYNLTCKIHPVIATGRASGRTDEYEIGKNYVNVMQCLFEKIVESDMNLVIEPIASIMNCILGISNSLECSYDGSCGNKLICLYANGDIGLCGRTKDELPLKYGNLNDNSLYQCYISNNAQRIRERVYYLQQHDCKGCSYFKYCHGGCTFEALNAYGIVEHKYSGCLVKKLLLDYLFGDGLRLMKKALLKQRKVYQESIRIKKSFLEELEYDEGK